MELVADQPSELDSFLNFLYDGSEGYVYLAAKVPNDEKDWKQEFFHYPTEEDKLKRAIRGAQATHTVYIAPALFNSQPGSDRSHWKGDKENFKCSNVVWIDFDGNAPADWSDFPGPPSYIIQTSGEKNVHAYWRLNDTLTSVEDVESITRSLAYNFHADNSGWDAVQVLRPPETFHHDESTPVKVISAINVRYDSDIFKSLPPIPEIPKVTEWQLSTLPDPQDVILKYAFGPDLIRLLKLPKSEVKDRSRSLQHLAFGCCELGMSDNEVFVMLKAADDNWEKFKHRRDRLRRLADIIVHARNKYPASDEVATEDAIMIWQYLDFISADITIDWVMEGMLMEQGNMLFGGRSGIGKTQIMLEVAKHIALGKDFLHYKIERPRKIGLLSLEMGHPDLQVFLKLQDEVLKPDERALLQENLTIIPHGEAWPLNTPVGQEKIKQLIDHYRWEGLFVDSIGSAILGDISASQAVQPFTNFNDRLRKEFGLFLWYIHHIRKAQPGANQRVDQDDFYGDQYLVNRATSAYLVVPGKAGSIRVRNVKNRLAKQEHDYYLERSGNLTFSKIETPVPGPTLISSTSEPSESTTPDGKFEL